MMLSIKWLKGIWNRKCLNMWWILPSPTLKMKMYLSQFLVVIWKRKCLHMWWILPSPTLKIRMYSSQFVICGGDLRKKLAESNTFKSTSIDVHITGPFRNKKTSKSHWVVVYGDSGKSCVLKPWFIWKYLNCLLFVWEKVKKTKVDIDHCSTYYKIGI